MLLTSDLPLIVSLEVHTSHQQQEIMVEIMKEYWGQYLVDVSKLSGDTPCPSVDDLRYKILVKVKYSPPAKTDSPQLATKKPTSTGSNTAESSESEDESQSVSISKGKIIASLGSMGVYTRSEHFSSFTSASANSPNHVFSLSEAKLSSVHARTPSQLFAHNKKFLLRAYPKGTRISSSNLDPAIFWRLGVQIVALNWQHVNEGTMLNHAMFDGTGGYVLKPPTFQDEHPSQGSHDAILRGTLDMTIEVFAASEIGKLGKRLKAYVKAELHVEQEEERRAANLPNAGEAREGEYKRRTRTDRYGGRQPDWHGEKLIFSGVKDASLDLAFVRFKIMDDDAFSSDDLVGWAAFRLNRLGEGVRLVRVLDKHGQMSDGTLLIKVTKKFVPYK